MVTHHIAKHFYHMRLISLSSIFVLIGLFILTIFPIVPHENSAKATSAISTSSITMTSTYANANLNLLAKDSTGTFATSSDQELAKFGVSTNNSTGYTLSIASSNNNGQLVNEDTGTSLTSITSVTDTSTFDTASYTGKWGYKPSKYNSIDNVSYLPAPTDTGVVLDATNTANDSSQNNYTIGLGARIDYGIAAGNYTDTFILTTVGNPVTYTINYKDNTGDNTVTNLPATSSGSSGTTAIVLSDTTPIRNGYNFSKWCLGTVSNNGTTCSGTQYAKSTGIDFIDQTAGDNTIDLYATWTPMGYAITIKTTNGISKVTLNGTDCTSTSGCLINNLTYGQSYDLVATPATGYSFSSWDAGHNGSITDTASASTTYTVGIGTSTITPSATANTYTLTLANTNATTTGSTLARVTYDSNVVYSGESGTSIITNPARSYTASHFSKSSGNYTNGASIPSSLSPITSTYAFDGWYSAEDGGEKIITSAGTLVANTVYTDSSGRWSSGSAPALYARWDTDSAKVTFPTITAPRGNTCGWTGGNYSSNYEYPSGGEAALTKNYDYLYVVCIPDAVTIKFNREKSGTYGSSIQGYITAQASKQYGTVISSASFSIVPAGTYSMRVSYGVEYSISFNGMFITRGEATSGKVTLSGNGTHGSYTFTEKTGHSWSGSGSGSLCINSGTETEYTGTMITEAN